MSFRSNVLVSLTAGCLGGMLVVAFIALLWVWLFGPFIEANVEVEGTVGTTVGWQA